MKEIKTHPYVLVAFILAAGMAISGYLLSFTLYRTQVANDTVAVKGLAERDVEADWAQVPIHFSRSILLSKQESKELDHQLIVARLYKDVENDYAVISKELLSLGLVSSEIGNIEMRAEVKDFRGDDGQHTDTEIIASAKILIESEKVQKVRKIDGVMSKLMSQGIVATTGREKYHFSKLNDIKPAMIREAMEAAQVAAKELAGNTGVKLGRIKSANQGRFTIKDKGENYSDTDRIDKKVRVVTEIKFYLSD